MLTIVDTPLGSLPAAPAPRSDPWRPELEPALLAGSDEARARLALPGALVVTTGQQPGLFGGPLYTLYKALSARALAGTLERRWGRPVVPVFWLAADDHDFAEASTAAWFGPDHGLVRAALDPRPADAPLLPMSREPVPGRATELIDQLTAALPAGQAREATAEWLRRHWRPGATLAGAFGGALAELLGPLGIAVFDPAAPAARRAAAPVLLAALTRAGELERVVAERAAALAAEGRDAGVKVGDDATLVFLDGPGGRDRIVRDGAGYRTRRGGEKLSLADLERIAGDQPERLSPNVLLRPVIESALLPTVGYLAGPGELRYLELAAAVYRPLGIPRQTPMPRWSGILVEPRVTRALEKFEITIEELNGPAAGLDDRMVRGLVPADFEPAFGDLRRAIEAGYDRILEVARRIDPTLEKPAGSARAGALNAAGDLEKRLLAAQKRRQGELLGQLERARTAVRPDGEPQERVISLPALVGRYGFDLVETIARHVEEWYAGALEGAPAIP